jgi:NADP-dependent 3-hydroxy acid dehydrogenase YdfG
MDIDFHSAGTGKRNPQLIPEIETNTTQRNAMGFVNMITCAFNYMKEHGGGHIAVITSVAGTRGMGLNPSYSSTKKFQITYLDALAQLARNLKFRSDNRYPSGFCKNTMLSHAALSVANGSGLCGPKDIQCPYEEEKTRYYRLPVRDHYVFLETHSPGDMGTHRHRHR